MHTCDGVINPITLPDIDTKFPHPIAAKSVIAEVAQLDSVDPSVNCDPCICVADLPAPFHEDVFLVLRQVMANLVHCYIPIFVYKRITVKSRLYLGVT